MDLRRKIRPHVLNMLGWRTNKRLVIIESDDWGMVRTTSRAAYEHFLERGYPVDRCHYNRNDALECNADMENLLETLSSVRDKDGNPAVLTANNIVANPDFERIRASDFREYHYQPFPETLARYPQHDKVMDYYREGIDKGLLCPQFHGREHVNVNRWLADLRKGKASLLAAFEQEMFSIHAGGISSGRREYLDALGYGYAAEDEVETMEDMVTQGLHLFKDIWGWASDSFIAPCYTWHTDIESILYTAGVRLIQGNWVQLCPPKSKNMQLERIRHYQAQKNELGQRYLIRNVLFEPSSAPDRDWVDQAMAQIKVAFQWKKPAIICSHRVNYIGYLVPENRDKNLKTLKILLESIKTTWPDVVFCSTAQLGKYIESKD